MTMAIRLTTENEYSLSAYEIGKYERLIYLFIIGKRSDYGEI